MINTYKILFLDIDGTILRPDHTIQQSTKDAINQLLNQNIEVILATGRPLHELSAIAKELNIHSFIGYNGAYAIYKDKEIVNEPMDSKTVDFYLEVAKNHGHEMVLYTNNKNTFTSLDSPIVEQFIDVFNLKQNDLYTESVSDQILGITLMDLKEEDVTLYHTNKDIHFSQVNIANLNHSFDVIRESVNKGRAVKAILEELNIPKESAVAFGDGMNDKEMLRFVGEGFAMGNSHPDLFPYAKHTTTDVTNSGIFNGLKQLGLVK